MDSVLDGGLMDVLKFVGFPRTITLSTINITVVLAIVISAYFATYILNTRTSKRSKPCKIEKPSKVPRHIAVIMDGNRRYGRKLHADPLQGHWAGGQTLVDFVQWCMEDGIEMLTVYAFSTENWNREEKEVSMLMMIIAKYAESFKQEAVARNVRVQILATDLTKLPPIVQESVVDLENSTAHCTGFLVMICLSYGSRAEITLATQQIAADCIQGKLKPEDINEETIEKHLTTKAVPDPDLLIRTSGEYRISNFLLWQLAYTELFFISKYWPEVTQDDLRIIIIQFNERQRRFGS